MWTHPNISAIVDGGGDAVEFRPMMQQAQHFTTFGKNGVILECDFSSKDKMRKHANLYGYEVIISTDGWHVRAEVGGTNWRLALTAS